MSTSAREKRTQREYRQIVSYVSENAWAILPSVLWTIRQIVTARVNGIRMSEEEVLEAIGGRRGRKDMNTQGAVALIPLRGVLVPHAGMMVDTSSPGTGLDAWAEGFQAAVDDPNVETILLDIDSPGGSAALVSETAGLVRAARARKNVVAVANTMAASAAYAIASQAGTLLVTPSGMVGSVGVYNIHEDVSAALEAEGVKPTIIEAPVGGFKTEASPFGPLSDTAKQHLQEMVDAYYVMFVNDVAQGRNIDAATVEANYGQGRLLTAKAALAAGMVDGIGSLDQTLSKILGGKPLTGRARQAALAAGAPLELGPGDQEPDEIEDPEDVDDLEPDEIDVTAFGRVRLPVSFAGVDLNGDDQARVVRGFNPLLTPATFGRPAKHLGDESRQPSSKQAAADAAAAINEGGTAMDTVSSADGRPPTLEELAAQQDLVKARMGEMNEAAAGRIFNTGEQSEFDELEETYGQLEATKVNLKSRMATLTRLQVTNDVDGVELEGGSQEPRDRGPQVKRPARIPDNIWDLSGYRAHAGSIDELSQRWTDGARRANELLAYESEEPDKVKGFVERLLAKDPSTDPSESFAHRILVAGNPAYERAFGKLVMGRQLSTQEEQVVRMAVSNTGLGAETPVPVTIDPSVILTSAGSTNPMRRLARVITITGNKWRGIASEGVTVEYQAEMTQVADQTPTFDAPEAEVEKAHGWVEFSIEVDQDWGSFRQELSNMFADAREQKEADKFLHGTGVDEPEGLIHALVAEGSSIVETASAGTLTLEDIEEVTNELPPRFDQDAAWLANKAFYSQVRGLAAAENSLDVWLQLSQSPGTPPNLIGYPAYSASGVSKAFTVGGEIVAVLGDFKRGFAIIDRIGLNVEIVNLVMGPNNRPKGSRGMYVYFRNTSLLLAPNAFRALDIAAT